MKYTSIICFKCKQEDCICEQLDNNSKETDKIISSDEQKTYVVTLKALNELKDTLLEALSDLDILIITPELVDHLKGKFKIIKTDKGLGLIIGGTDEK